MVLLLIENNGKRKVQKSSIMTEFDFSVSIPADEFLLIGPVDSRTNWLRNRLPYSTTTLYTVVVTSTMERSHAFENIPGLDVKVGTFDQLDTETLGLYDLLVLHEYSIDRGTIECVDAYVERRRNLRLIISVENFEAVPDRWLTNCDVVAVDWLKNPELYFGQSVIGRLPQTLHDGLEQIFSESSNPVGTVLCAVIDLERGVLVHHGYMRVEKGSEKNEHEDLLNCPICHGILFHPRTLPCGHSLCAHCLLKIPHVAAPRGKGPEMVIPCPMCRMTSRVGLVERMRENLKMATLMMLVPGAKQQLEERERDHRIACAILDDMLDLLVQPGMLVNLTEVVNGLKLIMHGNSHADVIWNRYSDVISERRTGSWETAVRDEDTARFDDFFFHPQYPDHRMLCRILRRHLSGNVTLSVLEHTINPEEVGQTMMHRRPSEWAHVHALMESFGKWINETAVEDGVVMLGGQVLEWIGQVFPEFGRIWKRQSAALENIADVRRPINVERLLRRAENVGLDARITNSLERVRRRLNMNEHERERVATGEGVRIDFADIVVPNTESTFHPMPVHPHPRQRSRTRAARNNY